MPMRPEIAAIIDPAQKVLVDEHNKLKLPCLKSFPALVVAKIKAIPAGTKITPKMIEDLVGPQIQACPQIPDPGMALTQPHPGFPDLAMKIAGLKAVGAITVAWLENHRTTAGANADLLMGTVHGILEQIKWGHLMPKAESMTFPEEPKQQETRLAITKKIIDTWEAKHGLPVNQIAGSRNAIQNGLPQVLIAHPFCY
jgi:hypothetical protein